MTDTHIVEVPAVTMRYLNALERIFCAEIDGRLLQSKAKVFTELADIGYCRQVTESLGRDRFGEISVTGWALTHAGRITYCMQCEDEGEP